MGEQPLSPCHVRYLPINSDAQTDITDQMNSEPKKILSTVAFSKFSHNHTISRTEYSFKLRQVFHLSIKSKIFR